MCKEEIRRTSPSVQEGGRQTKPLDGWNLPTSDMTNRPFIINRLSASGVVRPTQATTCVSLCQIGAAGRRWSVGPYHYQTPSSLEEGGANSA